MLIEGITLKRKLEADLVEIAKAMLAGVESWDIYQRLVGQAAEINRMIENVASLEAAAAQDGDADV